VKFTAVLELNGKTATGIEIPATVIDKLGGGKRALIRVTINAHTYASAIGSMDGRSMIPVSAENRAKAGINAGDRVTVDVVLDTEKREVELPADFAKVLAKNAAAKRAFDALSNSNKKRHVLSIEGAKTDETRQRRIAKALAELS
jgi:hypothetical protein